MKLIINNLKLVCKFDDAKFKIDPSPKIFPLKNLIY